MFGVPAQISPWQCALACVVVTAAPTVAFAACDAGVRIEEVLADPAAGPAGDANNDGTRHTYEDEFVEVVNLGPDAVDVAGWRLGDDDTSVFSWFEFPPATVLAPGERAVLFGGGSPQGFTPPAFVDDGRLGNGLTNGGDRLFLIDVAGDTVDSVSTISWPSDQSIVRPNRTCEPFVFHADPPGRGDRFSPGARRAVLDSIVVTPADTTATIGSRFPVRRVLHWSDGGDESIPLSWFSSDGAVLEIDPAGSVHARSEGTASIRAQFGSLGSTEMWVQVIEPLNPPDPADQVPEVVINEILADPPGGIEGDANGDGVRDTYEDEFVELFNAGADTVSLAGWRLGDDDQPTAEMFVFPVDAILRPGAYLALFGGGTPTTGAPLYADDGRIGNGLTNGGDRVILMTAGGDTVDSVFHPDWGNDQSVVRWPEGRGSFVSHQSPPGRGAAFSPGAPRIVLSQLRLLPLAATARVGERHGLQLTALYSNGVEEDIAAEAEWFVADTVLAIISQDSIDFRRSGTVSLHARFLEIDSNTETIVVHPGPNRPPVFTSIPDTTARLGLQYRYLLGAVDPDGDPWVLKMRQGPPWMALTGHLLHGTPDEVWPGEVVLALSDGFHHLEQRFPVHVRPMPHLTVTEVLADPPSDGTGDANGDGRSDRFEDEFVELFNSGDPVDLSGWRLSDDDVNADRQFVFPEGSVLPSNEYLLLFGGGQPRSLPGLVFVDDGRVGNGLTNSGDRILLLSDAEADTIISLEYSSRANIDQSLVLRGDFGYVPHARLPGRNLYSPGTAQSTYDGFSIDTLYTAVGDDPRLLSLWGYADGHRVRIDSSVPHWLFRKAGIADVSAAGMVRPLKAGSARIEAWVRSNYLTIGLVVVRPPPPPPNLEPNILSAPDTTAYAGGNYRYRARAADPEQNSLNFTFVDAPPWLRLHHATGLIAGSVPARAQGVVQVSFQVTDGRGGLAVQSFDLKILPPPLLTISEILPDPPAGLSGDANGNGVRETYGDEFVELQNLGATALNLAGLYIKDKRAASSGAFRFPAGSTVPAGGRIAVFGSGRFTESRFLSANGRIGGGLGNLADSVFVIDLEGPDTLARRGYQLRRPPGQSLVWNPGNPDPILHGEFPGSDDYSPAADRPVLRFARLVPDRVRLFINGVAALQVVGHYSDGKERVLALDTRWSSSDSTVVAVGERGQLTAAAPGTAEIRVRLDTFETHPSHVVVEPPLMQRLVFSPAWHRRALPGERVVLFAVHDSGEEPITYSWRRNGIRLLAVGARLEHSWGGAGEDTLEVEVRWRGERAQRQWILTANRAPVVNGISDSVATAGERLTVYLDGFDEEGDTFVYHLENGPERLLLNRRTGRITWRPRLFDVGRHELEIAVSDGFGSTRSTFNLFVTGPAAKVASIPRPRLEAWPNPFSSAVNFAIRNAVPPFEAPRVSLFDLTGQQLQTLPFAAVSGGGPEATWNGKNADGQLVASGIYIAVVEYGDWRLVKKLLCLR